MRPHLPELATRLSRAILSISNQTSPAGSWTPSLEQNLHRLGFRQTLNPSLVSQVIDPHLLSHYSLALGFFNWASQQPGFTHNSDSYNSILKSLSLSRHFGPIHSLLKQEMKKNGFAPDASFYNSVLEACCREDLLRPARKLWDEMFASGCSGNLKTYSILIQKFSKSNQIEEALVLYSHMLGKNVEPDIAIYTSLLQGLCQGSQLETAFEVFSKSVEQDVNLAATLLSTFILCLCKVGHFHAASKLLRGLASGIAHPDSHVTLLKGFADAGEVPLAKQHVEWVHETSPSMLSVISTELLAFLPSSPKADPILQILQTIQELSRFSN